MIYIERLTGQNAVYGALMDFTETTGRRMLDELRLTGRNIAVALARGTLAIGLDFRAKAIGEAAVARGLMGNSMNSPGEIFENLQHSGGDGAAKKFWHAYNAQDESRMGDIMAYYGMPMEIYRVAPKGIHWKKKPVLIYGDGELNRYISSVQKQVGKAKAGWSLAADGCGGHRGIPAWASGSKHPDATGGAFVIPGRKPSVTIFNRVSYIEEAMVATKIYRTVHIAEKKLYRRLETILEYETGNSSSFSARPGARSPRLAA